MENQTNQPTDNTFLLSYASNLLKGNHQTLRFRQIKINGRYSIDSRDVFQNVQTVLLHYHKCPYVTIKKNNRGKDAFFVKKGFNSHHLNRNKTDDSINNLIVVNEKNHNFCDFHGDKFVKGLITYEEYINTIKPFIVWGVL